MGSVDADGEYIPPETKELWVNPTIISYSMRSKTIGFY